MWITNTKYYQKLKRLLPSALYDKLLNFYFIIGHRKNRGTAVCCPICKTESNEFPDNTCTRCASSSRHRGVYLFLKRKTNLFEERQKFLHFAPEFGLTRQFKKQDNISYMSADYNAPRAMKKVDMMDIPFENNYFDSILSIDVMDDVPDDHKAISELYRVLKPGGWSIHVAPLDINRDKTYEDPTITSPSDRNKHFNAYANWRIYGNDFPLRFEEKGFDYEMIKTTEFCSEDEIQRMGVDPEFTIFLYKKPT